MSAATIAAVGPPPMSAPLAGLLPGGRLHLQHGPIDIVIGVDAAPDERRAAFAQAAAALEGVLAGLMAEIATLRRPLDPAAAPVHPVAARMCAAVAPHGDRFVTPMAAVAGAVADHVRDRLLAGRNLRRAWINNGGDVALHLAPGEAFEAGIVADLAAPALDARARIAAGDGVRGLATSGWRGRSHSLGIADAVTVLAADAAAADVAATLIANAVDADHPAIRREPASADDPDSDLGDRPVTVAVGPLPSTIIDAALARGVRAAEEMRRRGLIAGALIALQGRKRTAGVQALVGAASGCGGLSR